MKKFLSILLVTLMVFLTFSYTNNVTAATSKKVTLSTNIDKAKSFNSLEKVLVKAKWQVENDVDGKYVRFMAFKNVNPYGLSTGIMAVRSSKIGGYFIDVAVSNPNDKQVLDASRKILKLLGISVSAKQFTAIVKKAKLSNEIQTVKLGKHKFWVSCSEEELYFSEREGETHFR